MAPPSEVFNKVSKVDSVVLAAAVVAAAREVALAIFFHKLADRF